MAQETVLVTGASGAVGHFAVEHLRRAGLRVVATDLPKTDLPKRRKDLLVRTADLTDRRALARVLKDVDLVVHLAAVMDSSLSEELIEEVNLDATETLFTLAAQRGVRRFVFFSTAALYQHDPVGTYRENNPIEASNWFERSKEQAERFLLKQDSGPEVVILRPSLIYGPRVRARTAALACLGPIINLYSPIVIGLKGGPRLNWLHAEDAARAAVHLLQHGQASQIYNLGDNDALGFGDIVSMSLEAYGLNLSFKVPFPPKHLLRGSGSLVRNLMPFFDGVNQIMAYNWERVCNHYRLLPVISPQFDEELVPYVQRDTIILNDRLIGTGFRLKYQSIADGWDSTLAWYQENNWAPKNLS